MPGFLALVYFALRGTYSDADELYPGTFEIITQVEQKGSGPLAKYDRQGLLFRVGESCNIPYVVLQRMNHLAILGDSNRAISPEIMKPLGECTYWQTFEKVAPEFLKTLVVAFKAHGEIKVRVDQLWKDIWGQSKVLEMELQLPTSYTVLNEQGWCVTRPKRKERDHQEEKKQEETTRNKKEESRFALFWERILDVKDALKDSCFTNAVKCDATNPLFDARYFFKVSNQSRPLCVFEQAKNTSSTKEYLTLDDLVEWHKSMVSLMQNLPPNMTTLPFDYAFLFFSNKPLKIAGKNGTLQEARTEDKQVLLEQCPHLLLIFQSNIQQHLSPVFAHLAEYRLSAPPPISINSRNSQDLGVTTAFQCPYCSKKCKNKSGLTKHTKSCQDTPKNKV